MAFTYTTVDGQRVERNVAAAFRRMAVDFHKKFGLTLHVRSGTRTRAEQMALHQKYLKGGTLALHPDSPLAYHVESNPRGPRALDIYDSGADAGVTRAGNKRSEWIRKNAKRYGFDPAGYRFTQKEPWHIEYEGALYTGSPASMEDDMPTADEIARAVHNYRSAANGLKFGDMTRVTYDSTRYGQKGVRNHGSLTADLLSRLGRMEANQQAQLAALEALAKSSGADPNAILKAVQDGVARAMDKIEVTLTVDAEG